jgi:diguanylate cyclase (GGDEF)-like protein/PAS domain S-box-containing protein
MTAETNGGRGGTDAEPKGLAPAIDAWSLLEATPVCVVVAAPDGRIVLANRAAEELTGFARADLQGTALEDLVPDVAEACARSGPFEAVCRRADGRSVPVEVDRRTTPGSEPLLVITLRDASEAQAGREARLEAEKKFRALVEQISAITYTWTWRDDRYFVVYSSPQIETILGYTPDEWIADPTAWYDWVHPDDRQMVIAENKRCELTAEAFVLQYRMIRKDGESIWVEDSWVVVEDEHDGQRVFQGVVFDITERKLAEEEIAFLAYHDKLTGLPNRALFEEMLENALARARRHDAGVGVLFMDLDNFKLVNDSLGHHAGDELLRQLGERLRGCARETDLVARQGGDEFLMLLSDLERGSGVIPGTDATALVAEMVVERIREALLEPFELRGTRFYAAASIGVSLFPRDAHDAQTLLKNADAAMYQSKKLEPGGFLLYSTSDQDSTERLSLSSRLRRAVMEKNWVLHYQPIVDMGTGAVESVEALVRWRQPNGGLVSPGEFIPIAEEMGLIEAIGDWVLEELARQHAAWREKGLSIGIGYNLSPRQMWSSHVTEKIHGRLAMYDVDPHHITIEITESSAMADPDRTHRILSELRAWGFRIAIDDFGTGYSSLARLKNLPVDVLKIDRAFISHVDYDREQAGMVRAMIQLAQSLDMIPLAEGIETDGEFVFLRANGCRLAQGFRFAHPVAADQIPGLVGRDGGLLPAQPSSAFL